MAKGAAVGAGRYVGPRRDTWVDQRGFLCCSVLQLAAARRDGRQAKNEI